VPPGTGKWAISTEGGGMAAWRGDRREVFYIASDLKMMAVDVRLTPSFQAGTPHVLFQTRLSGVMNGRNNYVVSRDGKRFLIAAPTAETLQTPIHLILNWPALR
jgi:hypothetical protein